MVSVEMVKDLQNGTLDEVLTKYNTNLKEIFQDINNFPVTLDSITAGGADCKNIYYTKQHTYKIFKQINGAKIGFGTYKSFKDAKIVREELIKSNWDKSKLDEILKLNNIRSQSHKRRV